MCHVAFSNLFTLSFSFFSLFFFIFLYFLIIIIILIIIVIIFSSAMRCIIFLRQSKSSPHPPFLSLACLSASHRSSLGSAGADGEVTLVTVMLGPQSQRPGPHHVDATFLLFWHPPS